MSNAATISATFAKSAARRESAIVRRVLIAAALAVVGVFIAAPVVLVFYLAMENGFAAYWHGLFTNSATLHSIMLTSMVTPIAVVLNTVFGIAAAWLIVRFKFRGRTALVTMIDLPFSVSPVVVGLMLMLLFGRLGFFGPLLQESHVRIVFALPGIVLATMFVTLPFVARELIPVMEAIGPEEDTAAVSLGASCWQMFWRVTLPNIKWGLLYGLILCNARAMGEFGAVYVVSGRIENQTTTMPLQVQKLLEQGHDSDAFALASLLTMLAMVTLALKVWLERKTRLQLLEAGGKDAAISSNPIEPGLRTIP